MNIREFRSTERIRIVTLMREFGEYIEALDPMERTEFAPGSAEFFTDKLIGETTTKRGKILVAEEQGRIIGFIGGYVGKQDKEELMEAKKVELGVINEFFVTQSQRGKNVGSQLLEKLEAFLKQQGCTLLRLEVFAPNKMARSFYAKRDYEDRSVTVSKSI